MDEDAFGQADRFGGEGDAVYAALIAAHEGLSDAQSEALNARLVLLLAHAVGDPRRIAAAARLARASLRSETPAVAHAEGRAGPPA